VNNASIARCNTVSLLETQSALVYGACTHNDPCSTVSVPSAVSWNGHRRCLNCCTIRAFRSATASLLAANDNDR
jgi:hypothetical protein